MSGAKQATGAAVAVRGLTKRIRRTEVLSNITLDALPGRVTGLAGPNGCGKTMLMRAMVGLIRPTAGTVEVGGADPWERGADGPSVGLLLEAPAFLDAYTGLENLRVLAAVRGRACEDDLRAALDAVGLDPDDRRKYRAYSLGMKQRLGLAGAVAEAPDVVVLDEPTNALDAAGVELAVALVRAQAARGATVVIACHDAGVLRGVSDEIWHLAEGHVERREVLRAVPGEAGESGDFSPAARRCETGEVRDGREEG